MGKYVQIGTAALRTPEGDFLPAMPIYREVEQRSPGAEENAYIDTDALTDIFASKYSEYIKGKKK